MMTTTMTKTTLGLMSIGFASVLIFSCSSPRGNSSKRQLASVGPNSPCSGVIAGGSSPISLADYASNLLNGKKLTSITSVARCSSLTSAMNKDSPSETRKDIDVCVSKGATSDGGSFLLVSSYNTSGPDFFAELVAQGDDLNGSVKMNGSNIDASQSWTGTLPIGKSHTSNSTVYDSSKNTLHYMLQDGELFKSTKEEFVASCVAFTSGE